MKCSRRFGSVRSILVLSTALMSSACSVVGVPRPTHPDVHPPDREAELRKRRATWVYHPSPERPEFVTLPIEDLIFIGEDRDDHKLSAQAHHDAVEWEGE